MGHADPRRRGVRPRRMVIRPDHAAGGSQHYRERDSANDSEENSKFQIPNSRKTPNSKLQGGPRPAPNSTSAISPGTGGIRSWEHGLIRSAGSSAEVAEGAAGESFLIARGEADAPDIDGRVYVRGDAPTGEFVRVKIIGHTDYDL